jgi:nucleotide-binding universal stress UspA family protein
VLPGLPAAEIARLAQEGSFDLVVVATHGRRGVKRVLLGSVAERIVRDAPCTVLVVRPPPARAN